MKKNKKKTKDWKYPKGVFLVFLFLIIVLFAKYCYLALSPNINGRNMQKFAESRNTVSKTLKAKRGTIFDSEGNILAHNVTSYTLILYLDPSRSKGSSINHVKETDKTAKALAEVLEADEKEIKEKIENGKTKNRYQIELGKIGKNITEMKKDEIENLNLPGIDFIENDKRYYPNGDFASYILGYAKTNEKEDEEGNIVSTIDGELGIEAKFDSELKGTNGYYKYQQDRFGYKIPDTAETRIEAIDGNDIYLTIDSNIQRFVETEVQNIKEKYKPEWTIMAVMDAKTGDLLASSGTPSFNPNLRDLVSYQNPLVSNAFEPGSTMKTYTYMCAMEKGTYNGSATFRSGKIEVADAVIKDWNNVGWGIISYDKGYEYSSNVGVTTMINHFINRDELKECFKKYGFGSQTGIDLAKEVSGTLGFKYPVEVANATFGQGINTTAIQHLKALSMIANNGKELTPHVVEKIVDPNNKKTIYKRKIEKSETENKSSEDKIKELKEKLSSLQKEKENRVKPTSSLADTVILTDDNINSILDIFNTKLNFNLLYRASRDGKEYSDFKSKVGSHKNLLIIGKTDTNLVLGGYTINNLEGNGFVKDKFAFLYNFKKDKKFKVKNENEALYLKEGNFPCFGDDDITFGPGKQKSKFPKSYKGDKLELTGGESEVKFENIEIFYLTNAE